jgi:hypothetical protein
VVDKFVVKDGKAAKVGEPAEVVLPGQIYKARDVYVEYKVGEGKDEDDVSFAPRADAPSGVKYDDNKAAIHLVPMLALAGVGGVMGYGAKKYATHNWAKGIHLMRLIGACFRHLAAFTFGQDLDPESGLNHLDHLAASAMMAREMHALRPELDDRNKYDDPDPMALITGLMKGTP